MLLRAPGGIGSVVGSVAAKIESESWPKSGDDDLDVGATDQADANDDHCPPHPDRPVLPAPHDLLQPTALLISQSPRPVPAQLGVVVGVGVGVGVVVGVTDAAADWDTETEADGDGEGVEAGGSDAGGSAAGAAAQCHRVSPANQH